MEQSDEAFYTLINGLRANLDQGWAGDTLTEEDVVVLLAGITRLRAALADYERRILSAVEAVPASQIRAEALREAAALVDAGTFRTNEKGDFCGHDIEQHEYCDECLSKQILALTDAPKVTP
jgi:hypothetical protein